MRRARSSCGGSTDDIGGVGDGVSIDANVVINHRGDRVAQASMMLMLVSLLLLMMMDVVGQYW